jgi:hypothetical protein
MHLPADRGIAMVGVHFFYSPPTWFFDRVIDDFGNEIELLDPTNWQPVGRALHFLDSDQEI